MAKDKWDKFGSPYDPSHSGKMQKPKKPEERTHQKGSMCWCGDPNCPGALMGGNGNSGGSVPVMGSFTLSDEIMRMAMRSNSAPRYMEWSMDTGAVPSTPKGPPSTYTAARKEVEKWLAKAPDQDFGDIVGNDAALEQLRDAIQAPVKHADLYKAYGMKMPKGALLSGPPGCGKTMFARAAAAEMKRLYGDAVEFISISGAELQSPYVGVTEGYIKSIFVFAREYKAYHGHPLLVFMDEAEVLLPDRTGRIRKVAPWEESQVATFLAEMDGMTESGAFMLLATNRPEVIDQAVLRDGRCDFKITVAKPTHEAVEIILRKNFAGVLCGAGDVEELVFAAFETLLDPAKVIAEAHAIGLNVAADKLEEFGQRHFTLEHIVSGAMAASVPGRAKRYAFARDKASGVALGVTVADVIAAVNDLFQENKGLEHAFALEEFKAEFMRDMQAKRELK